MPQHLALTNDLRIAVARLGRRMRSASAEHELSFPHTAALGTLQKFGELTLQELSAKECVTPPGMLKTVTALVDAGLVERRPHDTDGRKQLLALTPEGTAACDRIRTERNAWLGARIDALTPDERAILAAASRILSAMAEV